MFRHLANAYAAALASFVLSIALASPSQAARLIISIQGIRTADGYVFIAFFFEA
jgi:uncharacterized protein (DUF2141 family)